MFNPYTFLSPFQIAGHLSLYMPINVNGGTELLAKEATHVRAAECGHCVMYQQRIKPPQVFGHLEYDVGCPLALVCGPVIVHWKALEDLVMDRIEGGGDLIQHFRPVRLWLRVHQSVRFIPIDTPGKTVVLPLIINSGAVHLTS